MNTERAKSIPEEMFGSIIIDVRLPRIERGRLPAKTTAGRPFAVRAMILREGHDILGAALRYRAAKSSHYKEVLMSPAENDHWEGSFVPSKNSRYVYHVRAWVDPAATWMDHVTKKAQTGMNLASEALEGANLLGRIRQEAPPAEQEALDYWMRRLSASEGNCEEMLSILRDGRFREAACCRVLRQHAVTTADFEVFSDRRRAEYGAWYELFPRSQGSAPGKHGTFRGCIRELGRIKKLGFDVIYLPPVHPIGETNRKGRNNSLKTEPGDPGSPWAIGGPAGGHKALHPELGSMRDFEAFVKAAGKAGIEIALDFAAQCSPDHPYAKEHPDWFYKLPDGSIRYAENPPKKYEDIYPINFRCEDRQALWEEMESVFLFWIERGVRIFRVDNPHTKPFRFWQWLIRRIQDGHPDVIFLAEAFTRPEVMRFLAKAGFSQSYTYFTWRNAKWEIRQYLEELAQSEMRYYFRPNFFVNTPDILPAFVQRRGPGAFKIRLVLAATLSAAYGIYSGFELCENEPLHEGSEEYRDSEKYEIKYRDWDRPGNINDFVSDVNAVRRENPALQQNLNLEFCDSGNDQVIAYVKWDDRRENVVLVIVNLDPDHVQEDGIVFPAWKFGIEDWQSYQVTDLLTGAKYYWKGRQHYVRLDPNVQPAHMFLLRSG